jgi:hypothetical protein
VNTNSHIWRRRIRITSVTLALILAVAMIAGSAVEYRRFLLCRAVREDCDQLVVALWPFLLTAAAALIAASILAISRHTVWPLVAVWATLCAVPLGIDVRFFMFSVICSPFFVLALLGLLPASGEARQNEPAPR